MLAHRDELEARNHLNAALTDGSTGAPRSSSRYQFRHQITKHAIVLAACLAGLTAPAGALDAAVHCQATKLKVAGQYGVCRLKAEATAVQGGGAPDFTRCNAKFVGKWSSAETAAAGQCQTSGDEVALQGFVTQHTGDVAAALAGSPLPDCPPNLASCQDDLAASVADLATCQAAAPGQRLQTGQTTCYDEAGIAVACGATLIAGQDGELQNGLARTYVDNGDGTISDTKTGLMWERLSADGGIHDETIGWDWQHALETKVFILNAAAFASHTDWRLPNRSELESLVDLGIAGPAIDAAFDNGCVAGCAITSCSCTGSVDYWSSTTDYGGPLGAWVVDFEFGDLHRVLKSSGHGVRAVRGGS